MKHSRSMLTTLLAGLLAVLICSAGYANSAPRLIPDPFLSSVGEGSEPLPLGTMIEVSLLVSGAAEDEVEYATERIDLLIAGMKKEMALELDQRQTAEFVLAFLHESLFALYNEYQTRIDRVISDGSFNCVSSAVLYMIFAKAVGIPVIGISAADHAFCSALISGERLDVETTNVYGFDPGKKKEFHDAFGNVTGYSYVPPSQYGGRTELSERELLALVLQNRISMLESEKRYAEAVGLAVDRFALAPGELTREHLTGEVINYAALLNERKEYKEAIDFLNAFVESYEWDEALRSIYGILHYNRIVVLIQQEAFTEAIAIMERAEAPRWIDPSALQELRTQIGERILSRDLPALSPSDGLLLLGSLLEEGLIANERYMDFAVMLFSRQADTAAARGDYLEAASRIESAIDNLGSDRRLLAAKRAYRYNYAVEAHNAFAVLYNDGEYEEAYDLLNEAIEMVPESSILKDDLTALRKVYPPS